MVSGGSGSSSTPCEADLKLKSSSNSSEIVWSGSHPSEIATTALDTVAEHGT
ncbi:predicted protein [Histoplasma mississippiense (nom. inval.)]|uniref:predicted protein n=1 Tax=Ajellomyces capsulatus (strain NAm1 / WU24) TaxID=2059318 RepID=UPI000157BE15|nr:predicted protein [Histoplasma mississippiense (nom. inval.)]EDN06085.1 predicted protein [Histoplasma mississippiense (nom. inval.)]